MKSEQVIDLQVKGELWEPFIILHAEIGIADTAP